MAAFKILGILAMLAAGMITTPDVFATQCSEDKNPIMSPSGKLACVFDDTFAKLLERGWSMPTLDEQNIQTDGSVVPTIDTWNTKDFVISHDPDTTPPLITIDRLFPLLEIEIPKSTPINDVMNITIHYDYSPRYNIFDNEEWTEFNPANLRNTISIRPNVYGEFMGPEMYFRHTKHLEMISDFPLLERYPPSTDYYGEGLYSYWITLPYIGNIPHTEQISFKVKKPMLYDQEEFHMSMWHGIYPPIQTNWYSSTNDGRLTMSPVPIYFEGIFDEFPRRGQGEFNLSGQYTIDKPGTESIDLDQIDSLVPDIQREIHKWLAKMNVGVNQLLADGISFRQDIF